MDNRGINSCFSHFTYLSLSEKSSLHTAGQLWFFPYPCIYLCFEVGVHAPQLYSDFCIIPLLMPIFRFKQCKIILFLLLWGIRLSEGSFHPTYKDFVSQILKRSMVSVMCNFFVEPAMMNKFVSGMKVTNRRKTRDCHFVLLLLWMRFEKKTALKSLFVFEPWNRLSLIICFFSDFTTGCLKKSGCSFHLFFREKSFFYKFTNFHFYTATKVAWVMLITKNAHLALGKAN